MAVIGTGALTLADLAKLKDPDGKVAHIAEILTKSNAILEDIPWVECNDGGGHITTIRAGLPEPTWRRMNEGVQISSGRTIQVRDTTGMLEAYGEVDAKLAALSGDVNAFRLSEDAAHLEGMNQEFATTLFYGDVGAHPERFNGLHARYKKIEADEDLSGSNIIDAGGTGDTLTSIWVVGWGDRTVHGLYPKGTQAGLKMQNLGEQTKSLADGSMLQVLRAHYEWDCGLSVKDWRYIVRIANIDTGDLSATSTQKLVDLLIQATEKLPDGASGVKLGIYCNNKITTALRIQIANKSNVNLSWEEAAGKKVLTFDGIPVRRCAAILNTETQIQ